MMSNYCIEVLQASCSKRHGYGVLQGAWHAWPGKVSSCQFGLGTLAAKDVCVLGSCSGDNTNCWME